MLQLSVAPGKEVAKYKQDFAAAGKEVAKQRNGFQALGYLQALRQSKEDWEELPHAVKLFNFHCSFAVNQQALPT